MKTGQHFFLADSHIKDNKDEMREAHDLKCMLFSLTIILGSSVSQMWMMYHVQSASNRVREYNCFAY